MSALPGGTEVPPVSRPSLTTSLEESRSLLLRRLHDRWGDLPSAIADDPQARAELVDHACLIFDMVMRRLLGSDAVAGSMATQIGRQRARQRIHPIDSIDAAAVLHDLMLSTACEVLRVPDDDASLVVDVSRVCTSIFLRVLVQGAEGHLGALLDEVADSHAAERRRMARELHDHTGHGLAVAQRHLELSRALRRAGEPDEPETPGEADQAVDVAIDSIRCTMRGVRTMIAGLRDDDDTSFAELLTAYVEQNPSSARIEWQVEGDENRVPDAVRSEVFLMVREALRNAQRHARASVIRVALGIVDVALTVRVFDNGIGLHPDQQPGAGMRSLSERCELLGGRIEFVPASPGGTTVLFTVPLPSMGDVVA